MRTLISFAVSLLLVLQSLSVKAGDDKPKRFSKSLDEETESKNIKRNSFTDYIPVYNSTVFVNYNISRDSFPQNETSVKISRKDPNRVVAAWRDFRTGVNPANRKVGYSYSTDGGSTWSDSKLLDSTLLPGFPRNSDPVVNVDSSGNFYIAVVCIGNNVAVAVYKSTDGGVTFPTAHLVANSGSEDKEMFDTDRTPGSPYYNTMYISWTRFSSVTGIKLTKSVNGGVNWTNPVAVSDDEFGVQGSDVVAGLNGEVYVTWLDGNTNDMITKFDKSTDGGSTFGVDKDVAIGPFPEISISSSNITCPSIAADISDGPNRGNIYIAFCDSRNGDPDIFLVRSTNRGVNWSTPLRINNDPVGNGKLQCWPWIEVNENGNIAIVFYDSRNTSSNTIVDAYLAHSTDGGISFANLNLSTQPSPTNQPNTAVRFGDYIGIDYHNLRIVPVWTDERSGGFNMECYTAIISTPVNANSISEILPDKFELKQNYPNPFNPVTVIRYSIPSDVRGQTSDVRLSVYNNLGKEIITLVNGKQTAGDHEVTFNGSNLSSGIYFYKLQTEDFVQTKSMILLR